MLKNHLKTRKSKTVAALAVTAIAAGLATGVYFVAEKRDQTSIAEGKVAALPLSDLAPLQNTSVFFSGSEPDVWDLAADLMPVDTGLSVYENLPEDIHVAYYDVLIPNHPFAPIEGQGITTSVIALDGITAEDFMSGWNATSAVMWATPPEVFTPDMNQPERILVSGIYSTGESVKKLLDTQQGLNTNPLFVDTFRDEKTGLWISDTALEERLTNTSLQQDGTKLVSAAFSGIFEDRPVEYLYSTSLKNKDNNHVFTLAALDVEGEEVDLSGLEYEDEKNLAFIKEMATPYETKSIAEQLPGLKLGNEKPTIGEESAHALIKSILYTGRGDLRTAEEGLQPEPVEAFGDQLLNYQKRPFSLLIAYEQFLGALNNGAVASKNIDGIAISYETDESPLSMNFISASEPWVPETTQEEPSGGVTPASPEGTNSDVPQDSQGSVDSSNETIELPPGVEDISKNPDTPLDGTFL